MTGGTRGTTNHKGTDSTHLGIPAPDLGSVNTLDRSF
eukprot:SAG11_NODE_37508_length_256_cov_1.318471_1_plen_36_part_10